MLTFAIPQSLPQWDKNNSASFKLFVIIADESPWSTSFWISIAFSISPEYLIRYNIGANVSVCTISREWSTSAITGFT